MEQNLQMPNEVIEAVQKEGNHKILWTIIIISSIVILAVLAGIILLLSSGTGKKATQAVISSSIGSRINSDGKAILPLIDGDFLEIDDENVSRAIMTPDREHVIIEFDKDIIKVSDRTMENKETVAEDCNYIYSYNNTGFIYYDKNYGHHLYTFINNSSLNVDDARFGSVSGVFYLLNDNLYALTGPTGEEKLIDSVASEEGYLITAYNVSDNGLMALIIKGKNDSDEYEFYSYFDGVIEFLCTQKNEDLDGHYEFSSETSIYYDPISVFYTKDEKMMVVCNNNTGHLWIKRQGEDVVHVKLGAALEYDGVIYSQLGSLSDTNTADVEYLYMMTSNDALYCIFPDGERERVLSNIDTFAVSNNTLFYTNDNSVLYQAKLDKAELSGENKIASDIYHFELGGNGEYLYYCRNYDSPSKTVSLYSYKLSEKEPVKITDDAVSSEVSSAYLSSPMSKTLYHSLSGNELYYWEDLETINKNIVHGTLICWRHDKAEKTKICSEVIIGTLNSGIRYRLIDSSAFVFLRFGSETSTSFNADWYYYDGKDKSRFAEDIVLSTKD